MYDLLVETNIEKLKIPQKFIELNIKLNKWYFYIIINIINIKTILHIKI